MLSNNSCKKQVLRGTFGEIWHIKIQGHTNPNANPNAQIRIQNMLHLTWKTKSVQGLGIVVQLSWWRVAPPSEAGYCRLLLSGDYLNVEYVWYSWNNPTWFASTWSFRKGKYISAHTEVLTISKNIPRFWEISHPDWFVPYKLIWKPFPQTVPRFRDNALFLKSCKTAPGAPGLLQYGESGQN